MQEGRGYGLEEDEGGKDRREGRASTLALRSAQVEALVQAEIDDPRPDASSFSFAIYQALVEELGGDRVKLLQADDDPSEVSTDAAQ